MKKIYPFSFYLLLYGANACVLPYMILYYQSLGFSGAQIGLLFAISPLITLFGAPFWTGLADTLHRHKLIMSITILGSIGLAVLFPVVKSITAVFVLLSLFSIMVAPINSFADTATLTMLGDQKNMYGRIRVGGTIGWGVIAPIAGIVIARYGLSWAFWSYAALLFIGFFVSQQFVYGQVQQQVSIKSGLRELLSNRRMILFLSTAFVTGIALTSINSFLSAYLNELGMSRSVLGFALSIATFAEFFVLFFGDRLLARLKPHGLLILAMFATTLRLFLYAIFPTTTGILAFQLINGFTFAALWMAGVSYINENAPPGLLATTQGVFGAAVFGFGSAAGGFIGALLLERVGGAQMYTIFGTLMFIMLIVYVLLERQLPRIQYAEV
ncbi:MAG: major facilitator superfamily domain-containing protein 6 [Chloroflexota bacterium]